MDDSRSNDDSNVAEATKQELLERAEQIQQNLERTLKDAHEQALQVAVRRRRRHRAAAKVNTDSRRQIKQMMGRVHAARQRDSLRARLLAQAVSI